MSPYPSPLPARWAAVLGTLGTALAAAAPALPWADAAFPVALAGFLAASVGGLAAAPPAFTEGRPLVQGTALTVATVALAVLQQLYPQVPAGWPQSVALAGGALLAWATGTALPHLGATVNAPPAGGVQS
jgi:hypothetical protein